ncbi:class I SAM-dependent methyltransferase [Streptomyces cyaneofuscatus]|uniref:class I SAM-dependent methyltransferase n=1 Tax=Streptomyces cyaneofuscatus TaxID=66883 RepID=UPI002953379F|nr:class I SAM-dependent methyltransferase [Streptomyces cyaneofuscatus]WOP09244.1 class I SAM-dependent methyltransferase [Streptomyces cyaneofuscatus]
MARIRGTERIHETEVGLQGPELALKYDEMQRHIRDRGWLQEKVDSVRDAGIGSGRALEAGCGPGYLGLEWLVGTTGDSTLTGVDISPAMLDRARTNARAYGVSSRTDYTVGNILELPFPDGAFDHAFSSASLHEWADPVRALREIHRVVRPGGVFCVSDLRRDIDRTTLQFMKANIAVDMRPGFLTSVRSAYTVPEAADLLRQAGIRADEVTAVQMGLVIAGRKEKES